GNASRWAHVAAAFAPSRQGGLCVSVGGDGCNADCSAIDQGWVCPVAGQSCVAESCGDQIIAGAEDCEWSLTNPVNACTDDCTFERDYSCQLNGTTGVY